MSSSLIREALSSTFLSIEQIRQKFHWKILLYFKINTINNYSYRTIQRSSNRYLNRSSLRKCDSLSSNNHIEEEKIQIPIELAKKIVKKKKKLFTWKDSEIFPSKMWITVRVELRASIGRCKSRMFGFIKCAQYETHTQVRRDSTCFADLL